MIPIDAFSLQRRYGQFAPIFQRWVRKSRRSVLRLGGGAEKTTANFEVCQRRIGVAEEYLCGDLEQALTLPHGRERIDAFTVLIRQADQLQAHSWRKH